MKLYKYLFFSLCLFFTSCEYDYDIDLDKDFTPKIVLNSIITPDSTISASIFWSQYIAENDNYKVVEDCHVTLYENSKIIFDGEAIDGELTTDIKPKEGAKYKIELDVPQYGKVEAETRIPYAPKVEIEYIENTKDENQYFNLYQFFNIKNISLTEQTRSIMIRSRGFYENHKPELSFELYANNSFCDQFNTVVDNYDALEKGSNINFEYFIRIPYKNINLASPLTFSVRSLDTIWDYVIIGYDQWGFPIYEDRTYNPTHTLIEVIATSDEYDRYYKTAYQQIQLTDDEMQIFNQIYPIHINVKNGLGIFAGYSSSNFKLENNEN